ncbi:unnamed protein product [Rotaria sp. Silwood2]|nr:unnamed protein product [Rotaria sp. Silwood2]CAF2649997.1 unnamed protein product [Rotaria sp. Silwood2]CAF3057232.1 unnamed protein product [Rotaria sp. Silwood2]CAF3896186.1 unnamed protein product [Rotaria sp. Silwood2]CAF3921751.1 unnamed protein product [Rotaria sp. Silwood2]
MPPNTPLVPPSPNSTIQSLVMRSSTMSTLPTIKTNSDSNNGSSSQRDDISVTSLHQKRIQLNNRKREEKKAIVTTKTSPPYVISTMEPGAKYRRNEIRSQSDFDNEDESSRWDTSD